MAVVEGTGDHALEYMTGGVALILGPTGRNIAAGMSGGMAFLLDEDGDVRDRVNPEMVEVESLRGARGPGTGPRPADPARRVHRQRGGRTHPGRLGGVAIEVRQDHADGLPPRHGPAQEGHGRHLRAGRRLVPRRRQRRPGRFRPLRRAPRAGPRPRPARPLRPAQGLRPRRRRSGPAGRLPARLGLAVHQFRQGHPERQPARPA